MAYGTTTGLLQGELLSQGVETVWQIGSYDGQWKDFSLAPDKAREFSSHYGDVVRYEVGKSTVSDFPFVHPGPLDETWSGLKSVTFKIVFDLAAIKKGTYVLALALADSHEKFAPVMDVVLNDHPVASPPMPLGAGLAQWLYLGSPNFVLIRIPAEHLRSGSNTLNLTPKSGSWVVYDAVGLLHLQVPEWHSPTFEKPKDGWNEIGLDRFSPDQGCLVFDQSSTGGHVVLFKQGGLVLDAPFYANNQVELEFAIQPQSGQTSVCYGMKDSSDLPIWKVTFDTHNKKTRLAVCQSPISRVGQTDSLELDTPTEWLRFHIKRFKTRSELNIFTSQRRLASYQFIHIPTAGGTIKLQSGTAGGRLDISDFRWKLSSDVDTAQTANRYGVHYDSSAGQVYLCNGRMALSIDTRNGLNPNKLQDLQTHKLYADSDYRWPGGVLPVLTAKPAFHRLPDGSDSVVFTARLGELEIQHCFTAPKNYKDTLTEQITLKNVGNTRLDTRDFSCGFAKRLNDGSQWFKDLDNDRFTEIPYRRNTVDGEVCEYTISTLASSSGWYRPTMLPNKTYTPTWGAEGWSWGTDRHSMLIAKYNSDGMEWSLLETFWRTLPAGHSTENDSAMFLRFGGVGIWKLGDPEAAVELQPGESYVFGKTFLKAIDGGWKSSYYAFRELMERLNIGLVRNFDPPVHWNELFDNPYWNGPLTEERRNAFYRKNDMIEEADKAHEIGCEALYLDPGWDTNMGTFVWGQDRLGDIDAFIKLLGEQYNLKLSLHTPLADWANPVDFPDETFRRLNQEGEREAKVCNSILYVRQQAERLKALCKKGVVYLMFDGSGYTGPCWDKNHGHSVPMTRQDHCEMILKLIQMVKQEYPHVLIELHDPIVAGVHVRYAPTYYLFDKPHSFDELWAYEYMWNPMDHILQGRTLSLYYYNLAYSIPLYLHINLQFDNEQALCFWWYASTCRHLGIGGKNSNPAVWQAHKQAMQTYLQYKTFFTAGTFYGIDELTHAHTLSNQATSVLNVFNFTDTAQMREITFLPEEIGLTDGEIEVQNATLDREQRNIKLCVDVPAKGHRLVTVSIKNNAVN